MAIDKQGYMKEYKKEYRKRPETKAKQREYMQKYNSKPEVQKKRKLYVKEYMQDYWKNNPDKYEQHKKRAAIYNKIKEENEKQKIQTL